MILSNTTNREEGLLQRCEDNCGLGSTGITGDSTLLSKFVGWLNQWNGMGAHYAIQSWHGHDVDDKGHTTPPNGYFSGVSATRDYNFDDSYKMLKVKLVNVCYDGTNYIPAAIIDSGDLSAKSIGKNDYESYFSSSNPAIDLTSQGFNLYPNFTAAQVTNLNSVLSNGSGGNKAIYVEWFRMPRSFATTGTDTYQPCLDFQFHHFPAVGASYEYCKLYLPEKASAFEQELYGNGRKPGLIKEIQGWYSSKQPTTRRLSAMYQNNK